MPLLRIDVIEGRSEEELKKLLDAIHGAMLAALKVPERDRYQIVHEHPATKMIVEDTGLGIPRTDGVVVVQARTRPRTRSLLSGQALRCLCFNNAECRRRLVFRIRSSPIHHRRTLTVRAALK